MSFDQIILLFWGLPVAILSLGIRRRVPILSFAALLAGAVFLAAYLGAGEAWLVRDAASIPFRLRHFGFAYLGAAILGGLIVLLLRYRQTDT